MAGKRKPGLVINNIPGKPMVLTIPAATEETIVVIWRQRGYKTRIRATRKIGIKT